MKKINNIKTIVLLFVLFSILIMFIIFNFIFNQKNKIDNIEVENKFSKEYIIPIQKDTFSNLLKIKYKETISINENNNSIDLKIINQGSKISDFYNDNENLLKENKYGFKIEKNNENNITANFKKIKINGVSYIQIPTDVAFRLSAN